MECGLVGDRKIVRSRGRASPLLQSVDASFDGVALLVRLGTEAGWTTAPAAPSPSLSPSVADLAGRLRDNRADAPAPEVVANGTGGVRAVGQDNQGPGAWSAHTASGHADARHHRPEGGCVTVLACCDGEGEGRAPPSATR